jgi:hypothetical protein
MLRYYSFEGDDAECPKHLGIGGLHKRVLLLVETPSPLLPGAPNPTGAALGIRKTNLVSVPG